jgi:four helix bundle protein
LIKEAEHAQSRADFINNMNIALKEANETEYWLMLLRDSEYISIKSFHSIYPDSVELIELLASIVKSTKKSIGK